MYEVGGFIVNFFDRAKVEKVSKGYEIVSKDEGLPKLIAERTTSMMGVPVPEVAFGWTKLALAEASRSN